MLKFWSKIFIFAMAFTMVAPVSGAGVVNRLPRNDWGKYGVNPWNLDTDYDGYSDEWEIKNGYCPTNPEPIKAISSDCKKGSYKLASKTYAAPASVTAVSPRGLKKFSSCAAIDMKLENDIAHYQGEAAKSHTSLNDLEDSIMMSYYQTPTSSLGIFVRNYANYSTLSSSQNEKAKHLIKYGNYYYYYLTADHNVSVLYRTSQGNWQVPKKWDLGSNMRVERMWNSGKTMFVYAREYVTGQLLDTQVTKIYTYSLTNPEKPVLQKTFSFQGGIEDSLVKDGFLYLALQGGNIRYAFDENNTNKLSPLLPLTYQAKQGSSASKKYNLARCNEIEYVGRILGTHYISLVAIPAVGSNVRSRNVFGFLERAVFEGDSLYLLSLDYADQNIESFLDDPDPKTEIYKFDLASGNFIFDHGNVIPGVVNDYDSLQFSQGNLAVAVNGASIDSEPSISLYTFDEHLNKVGWYKNFISSEWAGDLDLKNNLAKISVEKTLSSGYRVQSAVFNLSDPHTPSYFGLASYPEYVSKVTPLGNGYAIGSGYNSYYSTTTPGFDSGDGVKLGWFKLEDNYLPSTLAELKLGKQGSLVGYSSLANVIVSPDQKYIAFYTVIYDDPTGKTGSSFRGIMIYRLSETAGFVLIGKIPAEEFGDQLNDVTVINGQLAVFSRDFSYDYSTYDTSYLVKLQLYDFSTAARTADMTLK